MEITAQIAGLEEEVKVLKNEIKTILQELRTAVLASDNPLAAEGGPPVFRPVERSVSNGKPSLEEGDVTQDFGASSAADFDPIPQGSVEGPEPASPATNPGGPTPPPPVAKAPEAASAPQAAGHTPAAHTKPADAMEDLSPKLEAQDDANSTPSWNVSTIASLITWIDENSARLGQPHLHMVLDLATFAGLIPREAQETILKVIKLGSSRKDSASPSVNDLLVALRQLEAIFAGSEEEPIPLAHRRRGRAGGR